MFVHKAALSLVSGARSAAVATGLGSDSLRMGNKGGIGIAFEVRASARALSFALFALRAVRSLSP